MLSITDITNTRNPQPVEGGNKSINNTELSYTFTLPENSTCNHYQFRLALVLCPTYIEEGEPRRESIVNASLAVASVTAEFDGQQVQVRWPPVENGSYQLAITDLNLNVPGALSELHRAGASLV